MTLRASRLSGHRLFGHRSPSCSWSRLHRQQGGNCRSSTSCWI